MWKNSSKTIHMRMSVGGFSGGRKRFVLIFLFIHKCFVSRMSILCASLTLVDFSSISLFCLLVIYINQQFWKQINYPLLSFTTRVLEMALGGANMPRGSNIRTKIETNVWEQITQLPCHSLDEKTSSANIKNVCWARWNCLNC